MIDKERLQGILNNMDESLDNLSYSMEKGSRIREESRNAAEVAASVPEIVAQLDLEFEKATGIRKEDMVFLFSAVLLQSLRWILMPGLKLADLENQVPQISKEDRLGPNETEKKDGPYKGSSSGSQYERKELKDYRDAHSGKAMRDESEYYLNVKAHSNDSPLEKHMDNEFDGYAGGHKYRSWIEIMTQPVPYDAMRALDDDLIPSILGINNPNSDGGFSNIYSKNHHIATLGHDPVLGWVFGTANIMSSTISMVDYSHYGVVRGHSYRNLDFQPGENLKFSDQRIDYSDCWTLYGLLEYCIRSTNEDPLRIIAALVRQKIHLDSDKYCKEGLSIPILSSIDPEKAQELLDKGLNNEEFKLLLKDDLKVISKSAAIKLFIDKILEAVYLLVHMEDDISLICVRVGKILGTADVIVSTSNILYSILTDDFTRLDIGGIGIALLELFGRQQFKDKIKQEYLEKYYYEEVQKKLEGGKNV